MTLVNVPIANMVGGVSQQPGSLRPATTCNSLVNAYPSVISGLHKRQPTQWIAKLSSTATSQVAGHLIDKNGSPGYIVLVENGDLKVYDVTTGASKTVSFPDGKGYLSCTNARKDFGFLTIADTTFILNKTVKVTTTAVTETGTRVNPATQGSAFVYQAVGNINYSVYVNNALAGTYTTPGSGAVPGTDTIAEGVRASMATAGYTTGRYGSTATFQVTSGYPVESRDGYGDQAMRVYRDAVKQFADLPPIDMDGRLVKVNGDVETAKDDYYVYYDGDQWVETYGYNAGENLTATTMPYTLVDNKDGTFTFKKHTWGGRTAGDASSNPSPSFVNTYIKDIFVHKGRLGFVADENVILSATDKYETFYRTTLTQLLDSDPIDVASPTSRVAIMSWGVPFNKSLILFSDKSQFKVTDTNNLLTPKTIGLTLSTAYNCSTDCRPTNVGQNLLFVEDFSSTNRYASLYEYFVDEAQKTEEASEITAQVTAFIPTGVYKVSSCNHSKMVAVLTSGNEHSMFVYKYFWGPQGKVQSAWCEWKFASDYSVKFADFVNNLMFMIVAKPDGLHLEKVDVEDGSTNFLDRFGPLIDRRLDQTQVTKSYNSGTGKTTITLPYSVTAGETVRLVTTGSGSRLANVVIVPDSVSGTSVVVTGDFHTENFVIGISYEFTYDFNTLYIRDAAGTGLVSVSDGRVQVRYITLKYQETAYFTTEYTSDSRDTYTDTFTGRNMGSSNNVFGAIAVESGEYRMAAPGENINLTLTVKNDSPFPCSFTGAEWNALYYPLTMRRRN